MKDILRERYNKNFVDIIYYSSSSKSWFESLKKLLGDLYESINC